jgi:spore maturation protein CgeB
MKIAMFYHSVESDWNHGNAHFLRGVATELIERGHDLIVYEPEDSWSRNRLVAEHGVAPIRQYKERYPSIVSRHYRELDLDDFLDGVALAVVHEWNAPEVIARIGRWRAGHPSLRILFHDTHHRAVTAPDELSALELRHYDGVLAYGEILRRLYLDRGWASHAWTWHEAADTRVFHPIPVLEPVNDLVWIGNWGDNERSGELHEFLIEPCRSLNLKAVVHGVRYPEEAKTALEAAGITYRGWLANFHAPHIFAQSKVTVHVPRRPYVKAMPGIPTIRPFEALACGIPLVTAPWPDTEGLFTPGEDFLVAHSGKEMTHQLRAMLHEPDLAKSLADHGRTTIMQRHTCSHRVDELLSIYQTIAE